MTTISRDAVADNAFVVPRNKKTPKQRRVYIGNIPIGSDVKEAVRVLFEQHGLESVAVDQIETKTTTRCCIAFVACDSVEDALMKLKGCEIDGNPLVVEREKVKKGSSTNNKHSRMSNGKSNNKTSWSSSSSSSLSTPSFGTKSWSRPKTGRTAQRTSTKPTTAMSHRDEATKTAEAKPALGDQAKGVQPSTIDSATAPSGERSTTNNHSSEEKDNQAQREDKEDTSRIGFPFPNSKPLSELMADYGEQDLDFKKMVPTEAPTEEDEPTDDAADDDANADTDRNANEIPDDSMVDGATDSNPISVAPTESRLGQHGKAPIHVELASFGYAHSVPSNKMGWSHAQPLAPFDCRNIETIPPYMMKQCGLMPGVKRVVLHNDEAKSLVDSIATKTLDAIEEAIADGHGYALPLRMKVHIGSEMGRHRGVALCEASAIKLRKLLRANTDDRIGQPVSVGTCHRDIDRKNLDVGLTAGTHGPLVRSKQNELDDRW